MSSDLKKSILFVDDEPNILQGIKRMLHCEKAHWDMQFTTSGKDALDRMQNTHFDIIISDIRMPEMDGSALLQTVKKRFPHMIRFILSGYGDPDTILQAVGPTDQILSKPCQPEELRHKIHQVLYAKDHNNTITNSVIERIQTLPLHPDIFQKLIKALQDKNLTTTDLADIAQYDILLAIKLLQMVNTGFFGSKQRISSLTQAIHYLGCEITEKIILDTKTFSCFTSEDITTFDLDKLYQHSYRVGIIAKHVIQHLTDDRPSLNDAGLAGFTHDFGKLILMKGLPDEYRQVTEAHRKDQTPVCHLEKKYLGVTHLDIGGYLLELWGFPKDIVSAVRYHFTPRDCPHPNPILTSVHIANGLECNQRQSTDFEFLDHDYLNSQSLNDNAPLWHMDMQNFELY